MRRLRPRAVTLVIDTAKELSQLLSRQAQEGMFGEL
jgi:hypothetical protein